MTNPNHTDTSRSGDLKPCPFCGGEAVDFYRANTGATADWCGPVDHWVCCTGECGASTCMHGTKDEAIAAWNTRTADRIEALEAMVTQLQVDSEPSPYCPICGSCGEEGCCGSKRCLYPDTGMMDRIEALEAENERLRELLDAWLGLAREHLDTELAGRTFEALERTRK